MLKLPSAAIHVSQSNKHLTVTKCLMFKQKNLFGTTDRNELNVSSKKLLFCKLSYKILA